MSRPTPDWRLTGSVSTALLHGETIFLGGPFTQLSTPSSSQDQFYDPVTAQVRPQCARSTSASRGLGGVPDGRGGLLVVDAERRRVRRRQRPVRAAARDDHRPHRRRLPVGPRLCHAVDRPVGARRSVDRHSRAGGHPDPRRQRRRRSRPGPARAGRGVRRGERRPRRLPVLPGRRRDRVLRPGPDAGHRPRDRHLRERIPSRRRRSDDAGADHVADRARRRGPRLDAPGCVARRCSGPGRRPTTRSRPTN